MSKSFTFNVSVQVDVQNAEDMQQARESVFSLLSTPKSEPKKKGRPSSTQLQPKATVTGIQIPVPVEYAVRSCSDVSVTESSP